MLIPNREKCKHRAGCSPPALDWARWTNPTLFHNNLKMSRKLLIALVCAGVLVLAGGSFTASLILTKARGVHSAAAADPAGISASSAQPAGAQSDRSADERLHTGTNHLLSLTFAGDIMAHEINSSHRPYDPIYAGVAPELKASALTFGNLELTVDDELPLAGYPLFNVHTDYLQAAVEAGFNVFSVANNHVGDYGEAGVRKTYALLDRMRAADGIAFSGIRPDEETQFAPVTINVAGWKIGFLAVTELLNRGQAAGLVNIVDYRDPHRRSEFLSELKRITPDYDLFILSVHGGVEYALTPDPQKIAFFRQAVEAGVSIVWSQHPHVLQPWELMSVGRRTALIISSNGNFVSGQISEIDPAKPWIARAYTGDSALFSVRVERAGGAATVASVEPLLISSFRNGRSQMVVRPLALLAAEELPAPWHDYYAYRYRVMSRLVHASQGSLLGQTSAP